MNASALPRRVILAAFAALSSGAMADAPVQPGGWEMKAVITARENPSSPPKTLTESTTRVCLTKDFLAKDPYLTPGIDQDKMEKKGAKCSISDPRRAASSASWKMNCVMADGNSVDMHISNTVAPRKIIKDFHSPQLLFFNYRHRCHQCADKQKNHCHYTRNKIIYSF